MGLMDAGRPGRDAAIARPQGEVRRSIPGDARNGPRPPAGEQGHPAPAYSADSLELSGVCRWLSNILAMRRTKNPAMSSTIV